MLFIFSKLRVMGFFLTVVKTLIGLGSGAILGTIGGMGRTDCFFVITIGLL